MQIANYVLYFWSFLLACNIYIFPSICVLKIHCILVSFDATLGSIFVQKRRNGASIALSSRPIITLQRILHGLLLNLLPSLHLLDLHSFLTHHQFIFAKNWIIGVTTKFGLWKGEFGASEINSALRVIKVGNLAIVIDEHGHLAQKMRAALVAILPLNVHAQEVTGATE